MLRIEVSDLERAWQRLEKAKIAARPASRYEHPQYKQLRQDAEWCALTGMIPDCISLRVDDPTQLPPCIRTLQTLGFQVSVDSAFPLSDELILQHAAYFFSRWLLADGQIRSCVCS